MGSSVYMKMTNEEFDYKLVCKRYGGYNLKYRGYLYFEDDFYWDCCDYNAIMNPDTGWALSNIKMIISDTKRREIKGKWCEDFLSAFLEKYYPNLDFSMEESLLCKLSFFH